MKYRFNVFGCAIVCAIGCAGGVSYSNTVTLPNCKVTVDFFAPTQKKSSNIEGGSTVDTFTAIHGTHVQSAWCGPGTAKNAAEMRELMSFVKASKKLWNVRSNVANSPVGWLFFAEADSMANDGVTPTRFEYQCRTVSEVRHVMCLVVADRQQSFPREVADKFFGSIRYQPSSEATTSRSGSPTSLPAAAQNGDKEKIDFNLLTEALDREAKSMGRHQPWGACISPLLSALQDGFNSDRQIIGTSKLAERRTSLGKIHVLLVKRKNSSTNNVFECEMSEENEFISGRVIR